MTRHSITTNSHPNEGRAPLERGPGLQRDWFTWPARFACVSVTALVTLHHFGLLP